MTITQPPTIERLSNLVPNTMETYAVWWYGRVVRNQRDGTQPKIEVLFREVDTKGIPLKKTLACPINVAALGQVPLGSIWHNGRNIKEIPMQRRRFIVDFSQYGWDLLPSLHEYAPNRYLIPPFSHSILKDFNRSSANSWVIRFRLQANGFLVVPSIVYYLRAYGLSSELHRILMTYPWHEAYKRLFRKSPQLNQPIRQSKKLIIRLGPRLQHSDAPFLAHMAYDPTVQKLAKQIWAQLAVTEPGETLHLQAVPWHRNTGEIEVQGNPLPGNGFLALRIEGLELPASLPIEVIQEQKEKAPSSSVEGSERTTPMLQHTPARQEMPLSDDEPPDHGYGHIQINDNQFQWLGTPPDIRTVPQIIEQGQGRGMNISCKAERLSAGDAAGSGNRTGKMVAHTPIILESRGTLWDMWSIFHTLHEQHPNKIRNVACLQWDGRALDKEETPILCPIPRNITEKKFSRWLFLDTESQTRRGVLLILVETDLGNAIIVEIQRRTIPGHPEREIESFKGLTVRVEENMEDTLRWLKQAVSLAAEKRGVFSKEALQTCPSVADTFKHKLSGNAMLRENTAWLALRKVGCARRVRTRVKEPK